MSCFGRRGMGDREDSDDDDVVLLPPIDSPAVSISSLPDWCPRGIQWTEECSKDLCIEGQHPALDARSRLLSSPFIGRYSWYAVSQPRDDLSRRVASTGQAGPVCIPLMMSFSRSCWPSRSWPRGQTKSTGGEFLKVLPDLQPIPSCWERPRRLPRRVSGRLHLEREFLICFTPPRHLGKGARVWERAQESNPHHSGRPISPTAPKRLSSQLVAPSLPPFHIRICICSPGNQNTLSSLPAANPC